jgi:hypothetical protein
MIQFGQIIKHILLEWTEPKYEQNNVQKNFDIIKKSIETGGVIEFYYLNVDGLPKGQYRKRVCEGYELAVNKKDNIILSGWWVAQFSKSGKVPVRWREYLLSNMKQIRIIPRKQRIVRDLWAGGTHKNMKKVLVSISDYFKPKNIKKDMELINKEKRIKKAQDVIDKKLQKSRFQEPDPEPTGEFDEYDLTEN